MPSPRLVRAFADGAWPAALGGRVGALVHAVLAAADFAAAEASLPRVAAAQGRVLGATEEEVRAAIGVVQGALQHPLLERARASAGRGECRRETPVLLRLPDGSLLEGVVDIAFRESGPDGPAWTVVDFKTDVEIAGRRAEYETQVQIYARAVAAATG